MTFGKTLFTFFFLLSTLNGCSPAAQPPFRLSCSIENGNMFRKNSFNKNVYDSIKNQNVRTKDGYPVRVIRMKNNKKVCS